MARHAKSGTVALSGPPAPSDVAPQAKRRARKEEASAPSGGADLDHVQRPFVERLIERQTSDFEEDADRHPTLLVRRTLRSGQRVRFDGNVVVLGDVNPGAEITARGDIVVMGWIRGLAHAGADGDDARRDGPDVQRRKQNRLRFARHRHERLAPARLV